MLGVIPSWILGDQFPWTNGRPLVQVGLGQSGSGGAPPPSSFFLLVQAGGDKLLVEPGGDRLLVEEGA